MNAKTLFERVRESGIPYASHESDLYVQKGEKLTEILRDFPLERSNATSFAYQGGEHHGELWADIPFAYLPFWQSKAEGAHK